MLGAKWKSIDGGPGIFSGTCANGWVSYTCDDTQFSENL